LTAALTAPSRPDDLAGQKVDIEPGQPDAPPLDNAALVDAATLDAAETNDESTGDRGSVDEVSAVTPADGGRPDAPAVDGKSGQLDAAPTHTTHDGSTTAPYGQGLGEDGSQLHGAATTGAVLPDDGASKVNENITPYVMFSW
jgi:hypothetical protein